jgi:hypothetical protein
MVRPEARVVSKKRGEDRTDPAPTPPCGSADSSSAPNSGWGGMMRALAAARRRARLPPRRAGAPGPPDAHEPGVEITSGELHVGSRSVFAEAGLAEIAHHQTPLLQAHRLVIKMRDVAGPRSSARSRRSAGGS